MNSYNGPLHKQHMPATQTTLEVQLNMHTGRLCIHIISYIGTAGHDRKAKHFYAYLWSVGVIE